MRSVQRNMAAPAAMLSMCLLFAACLPVPIGNPERSRIDANLSGMWVSLGHDPAVVLIQPYDKRTWLVIRTTLVPGPENDRDYSDTDFETYDEVLELVEQAGVGAAGISAGRAEIYKAWRTRLAKRWFLTWEYKGIYDAEKAFAPEWWLVFKLDEQAKDQFSLRPLDRDFEGFENVAETRSAYERVIRKQADNQGLYAESETLHVRVRPEHIGTFKRILNSVINDPT